MIARIHDDHDDRELKIGSTISLIGLSIRLGKHIDWVRRQGVVVSHLGETWEADFYNGGRRRGYVLVARMPTSMCIERTVQQDDAATMK